MRDPENIVAVSHLNPAYMGFIFYKSSPRYVGQEFIVPSLDTVIKKVGVFVNATVDEMIEKADRYQLDYLQLHGDESVEFCEQLKGNNRKLIKVFSVDADFDFNRTIPFEGVSDYFLFDTKGKNRGGNGLPFDWRLLEKYNQRIPFFLSGGLSVSNLNEIDNLLRMNIHALDFNSRIEKAPGLKDVEQLLEIMNRIIKF